MGSGIILLKIILITAELWQAQPHNYRNSLDHMEIACIEMENHTTLFWWSTLIAKWITGT